VHSGGKNLNFPIVFKNAKQRKNGSFTENHQNLVSGEGGYDPPVNTPLD